MKTQALSFKKIFSNPFSLSFLVVVASVLMGFSFRYMSQSTSRKLMEPLYGVGELQANCGNCNLDSCQVANYKKLNEIILSHKEHHKQTFLKIYEFHFSSISQLIIFSILSGILLFIIGQKSWKNSHQITRALFLTCGALTSYYALSINTYKQDVVINRNIESYILYDNLQKEVFNHCITTPHRLPYSDTTLSQQQLYSYVTKRLIEINNIYIEFDKDAVGNTNYLSLDLIKDD